jgi:hypothetical protein
MSGMIDPKTLINWMPLGMLGLYEPISGLMLFNASDAEIDETTRRQTANELTEEDVARFRTINHELYHFAQATASGYMFERQCQLFNALLAEPDCPSPEDDPLFQQCAALLRANAGDDLALNQRADRLLKVLALDAQVRMWNAETAPNDNSLAGVRRPGFFRLCAALAEREAARNGCGLSIKGVLEGSAVVHANLLTYGPGDHTQRVEAELASLPPVYGELYAHTCSLVGDRTLELLLPTVALALHYTEPHMAYCSLLALVAESPVGEAMARGRCIAAALPALDADNPVLGNSIEVRRRYERYIFYDKILEKIGSGELGVSCYSLLADPQAMHTMYFPVGVITQDGYRGPLEEHELFVRTKLAAFVLRVESRRRIERDIEGVKLAWTQEVGRRLLGIDPLN